MRRNVSRIGAIATMLAGMLGASHSSFANNPANKDAVIQAAKVKPESRKRRVLESGDRVHGWTRPAAPKNQRQFRKRARQNPHSKKYNP